MTKIELENLIEENGVAVIYLQKSLPMDFVEEYIEFLDIPYLFIHGCLEHDFADKYREEIESFTGEGSVDLFLTLQEYVFKYFRKEFEIKNYGLPDSRETFTQSSIKLKIDYEDYEIIFSFLHDSITINFELLRLPGNADLRDVSFYSMNKIKASDFNEDTFVQTINEELIKNKWGLYFDF